MTSIVEYVVKKYGKDKTHLLDIFRDIQEKVGMLSDEILAEVSVRLNMSEIDVEGTATFYHFFSRDSRGKYTIYLDKSATSEMAGLKEVAKTFEEEVGIEFGQNSSDGQIGLYKTSCVGMCDQGPAAIINNVVFVSLTPNKVKKIIHDIKSGKAANEMISAYGDGNNSNKFIKAMVNNNIQIKGPVFFSEEYAPGSGLGKAFAMDTLDVIEEIKKSNLRGRGGAGFPTGTKWGLCRAFQGDTRYVLCNADEGEPGTFKDRVLLTERAQQVFEGMVIAGYALEASKGIMYLRAEYLYLREYLENILEEMREKNLLGKKILKSKFSFDISIKVGAGAYICGEESALIESAEGKRGEPRNRPPFPVQVGYLGKPTIVNNVETYGCVAKIMLAGADWFKSFGTQASAGVKLLSVSGDCERPGIYEIEWGKTVQEVLDMVGANDVYAVQVGGPSGNCISKKQFGQKICYSDLSTGGAFTVFGKNRNILDIVHNYMEFFSEESCGFCVPCRAGNVLLTNALEKIMKGNGTSIDIKNIEDWGKIIKTSSRCGLGQTSPNPLLTSIKNFREVYEGKVRKDVDYMSQFDLGFAVEESCKSANRTPNPK